MTDFYERALRRIIRITICLGLAGTLAALVAGGPRAGAGFLAGSLISLVNFRFWMSLAAALGGGSGKPPLRPTRRPSTVITTSDSDWPRSGPQPRRCPNT